MKIARIVFILLSWETSKAFAPISNHRTHVASSSWSISSTSSTASDFQSAMPDSVSAYERIGIERDQLALGVNAEEVAEYVGT